MHLQFIQFYVHKTGKLSLTVADYN